MFVLTKHDSILSVTVEKVDSNNLTPLPPVTFCTSLSLSPVHIAPVAVCTGGGDGDDDHE